MSTQRFDSCERYALWEAWAHECAFCGKPISLKDMEIDHIVPEKGDRPMEDYGLPASFDVSCRANLCVACTSCNRGKSSLALRPGFIAILHTKATNRLPAIEATIEKERAARRATKAVFKAIAQIKAGDLPEKDLWNHVGFIPIEILNVPGSTKMAEAIISNPYSLGAICDELLAEPIDPELTLRSEGGAVRICRSLAEYERALEDGLCHSTNFDLKFGTIKYLPALRVLRLLGACTPATTSAVDYPRVGVNDLDLLPREVLFPGPGGWGEAGMPEKSVGELVREGYFTVRLSATGRIHLENDGTYTHLSEILRADVDGDGRQDLLTFKAYGVQSGSFSRGAVVALAREGPDTRFELIELPG